MTSETAERIDVGGFAAVINSRLAVESRVARAVSLAWFAGGTAIACSLSGLGIVAALYGYSYMISVKPAAELVAKAMVEAIERTQLRATVSGTMSFAPNTELKLTPGQTVKLEEGGVVKLAPNSSVRVIADVKVDMPQPSNQQLQLGTTGKSNDLPFTTYTIFRSVTYGPGEVVTGWHYALSDRQRPRFQHCYYALNVDKNRTVKYLIAFDGIPQKSSPLEKVDFDSALANCIWFSGV